MKVRVGTGNQKEINTYIREKEDHFEDSTKSVCERFLVSSNNNKKNPSDANYLPKLKFTSKIS